MEKKYDSDARPTPPSFDEMVDLIKKLFIDYLEDVIKSPPSEIAKSWERYKTLNHLYQNEKKPALLPLPEPILNDDDVRDGGLKQTAVYVPCHEDDPRACGGYTSTDGQRLCYVRESNVPVIEQGAVWVKGHYDRLYDRLTSGGDKPIVCFVDYDTKIKGYIFRDICTAHPDTLEFTARGIGYGSVRFMNGDDKENFIGLCKMINIEWLDEGQ